jgi:hypothetical protein
MDQEDVNRFGTQRAAEIAAPLISDLVERLGLDLDADDRLAMQVLSDRLHNPRLRGGLQLGCVQTTAEFLEQLPPGAVNPKLDSPAPGYDHALGEGPEWDEPAS